MNKRLPGQSAGARLRAICLALPEACEQEAFGGPTFRVREKIFAMETGRHGFPAVWCKAPAGSQAVLVGADPARFFVPPYVGPKGGSACGSMRGRTGTRSRRSCTAATGSSRRRSSPGWSCELECARLVRVAAERRLSDRGLD